MESFQSTLIFGVIKMDFSCLIFSLSTTCANILDVKFVSLNNLSEAKDRKINRMRALTTVLAFNICNRMASGDLVTKRFTVNMY